MQAQNNKNEKFWRELWDVILHKEPLVASLRLLLDSDESMVLSAAIAALSQLTRPIAPATSLHGGEARVIVRPSKLCPSLGLIIRTHQICILPCS